MWTNVDSTIMRALGIRPLGPSWKTLACALGLGNAPSGHFVPLGAFLSPWARANIFQLGPQAKCLGPHSVP